MEANQSQQNEREWNIMGIHTCGLFVWDQVQAGTLQDGVHAMKKTRGIRLQ